MPELPEVETTRLGIAPYLLNQQIEKMIIRERRLRWPIVSGFARYIKGAKIEELTRRGKYLLIKTSAGTAIWHLGMSGSLRLVDVEDMPDKHDHVDWLISNGKVLRYCDPRRFGSLHWTKRDPLQHKLLISLGVEPLSVELTGEYLFERSRKRVVAVKQYIMNSHIVVGVGNIYANEALFQAGIHPQKAANQVSLEQYQQLVTDIKQILKKAIQQGGTTLRNFVQSNGKPGYFKQSLSVYGRGGEACMACGSILIERQLGQRATVFCKLCQT